MGFLKEIIKGKRTRVKGKIYTDDWELPMLQKKFKSIISEHGLSSNIQRVCQLEDRPLISRFFSKTSREVRAKEAGQSASPVTEHSAKTMIPVHTPKSTLNTEDEGGGHDLDRQKTPMKKRVGKAPGSASLEHDDDVTDPRLKQRRQRDEENQTNQVCAV